MALSTQNANLISELMQIGEELLDMQRRIDILNSRWNQNDAFKVLNDEDISAVPAFAHLTKDKIANGITGVTAVTTALGDLVSGQAVNLVKLKG